MFRAPEGTGPAGARWSAARGLRPWIGAAIVIANSETVYRQRSPNTSDSHGREPAGTRNRPENRVSG
jgi:hypothetical protein